MTNLITIISFFLQWAASQYIAPTTEQAFEMAHSIIPEGGKPGNICGPLAIKILQDAHILSKDIDPKSFWFLVPWDEWTNEHIIEEVFKPSRFTHIREKVSIAHVNNYPFRLGDFVFLYSGEQGTFSHMFVVTYIDKNGNPYTVTNYQDEDGWHIDEIMIYDLFELFIDPANNMTFGNTGYGGFSIWREINYCSED